MTAFTDGNLGHLRAVSCPVVSHRRRSLHRTLGRRPVTSDNTKLPLVIQSVRVQE